MEQPPLFRIERHCFALVLAFAAGSGFHGGISSADRRVRWQQIPPPPSPRDPVSTHRAVGLALMRTCRAATQPHSALTAALVHQQLQLAFAIDHRLAMSLMGEEGEEQEREPADATATTPAAVDLLAATTRRFLLSHAVRLAWRSVASPECLLRMTRRFAECGTLLGLRDLRLRWTGPAPHPVSPVSPTSSASLFDLDTLADAINQLHQLQVLEIHRNHRVIRLPFGRLTHLRSLHTLRAPVLESVSWCGGSTAQALLEADCSGLMVLPALTDLQLDVLNAKSLSVFVAAVFASTSATVSSSYLPPRLQRIRLGASAQGWGEASFVQLARVASLTDLDTQVPISYLNAIASLSQLRTLKCGGFRYTPASASLLASQLRALPNLQQLESLVLEAPIIRPLSQRERIQRGVFTASLLLSALRGSCRLTALTLRWPHLTSADVAALLALPIPLRTFEHHFPRCDECDMQRNWHQCADEEEEEQEEEDYRRVMDADAHGEDTIDPALGSAAVVTAAIGAPFSSALPVSACLTLTDAYLSHHRFTNADLGHFLRSIPSVRRLRIDLPRLTHLRAFAQLGGGVAQQLEELTILADHHPWRTDELPTDDGMKREVEERAAAHQAVADELQRRLAQPTDSHCSELQLGLVPNQLEEGPDSEVEIDWSQSCPSLPLATSYLTSAEAGATLLAPLVQLPALRRIALFGADVPLCALSKQPCSRS